jgi:hypothetical protein
MVEKYENPILRLMVMSEEVPHKVVGYMTVQPMEHGLKLNALASKPDVILDAVKGVIRESGQSVEVRLDRTPSPRQRPSRRFAIRQSPTASDDSILNES